MHGIQYIVGGTVHNAANLIHGAQAFYALQVGQPGDSPANGRRGTKAHACLPCKCGQVIIAGSQQLLIGSDDIFPRTHRCGNIIKRRLHTAHDLHNGVHVPVVQDNGKISYGAFPQFRDGFFIQHIFNGKAVAAVQQLRYTAAHGSMPKDRYIHLLFLLQKCRLCKNGCISTKSTCIFVEYSISYEIAKNKTCPRLSERKRSPLCDITVPVITVLPLPRPKRCCAASPRMAGCTCATPPPCRLTPPKCCKRTSRKWRKRCWAGCCRITPLKCCAR